MSDIPQVSDEYDALARECLDLIRKKESDATIAKIEQMVAIDNSRAEAYYLLGLTSLILDEKGRAVEYMEKAVEHDPECFEYAEALANLYTQIGRLSEGLFYAKLSTTLMPHPTIDGLLPEEFSNYFVSLSSVTPSTNYLRGRSTYLARKFSECISHFDRELRINPDHADCRRDLGDALRELGSYSDSLGHLAKAAELRPDDPETRLALGKLCYRIAETEEAVLQHKSALGHDPDSLELASAIFARSARLPAGRAKDIDEFRAAVAERGARAPGLPPEAGGDEGMTAEPRGENEKIRIAYLSNRCLFGEQARMLEPILRLHDRNQFEVLLYNQSDGSDSTTQRLNADADQVREVARLDDDHFAVIVAGDEVDILVDLCMDDLSNRATLMNMHPAKVQLGAWGARMGLEMPGIDVVLSDAVTDAAVKSALGPDQQAHCLQFGLFSFDPNEILPDVGDSPIEQSSELTIGLPCDAETILSDEVAVVAKILDALPNAKITIGGTPFVDREIRDRLTTLFHNAGLMDRVSFSTHFRYADRQIVDPNYWLSLDAFLDIGGGARPAVVADALWMGVPVLSLKGETPFKQLGASALFTAGKPEWIADDPETFVQMAVAFLSDVDGLAEARRNLRGDIRKSLLFNPEANLRAIEQTYKDILESR